MKLELMFCLHKLGYVSIPKRVSEVLKLPRLYSRQIYYFVSIPKRVSEVLKLARETIDLYLSHNVSIPKRVSEVLKP